MTAGGLDSTSSCWEKPNSAGASFRKHNKRNKQNCAFTEWELASHWMSKAQNDLVYYKPARLHPLGKTWKAFRTVRRLVLGPCPLDKPCHRFLPSLSWTPHASLDSQFCEGGICLAQIMLLAPSTEFTQHGHSINICWVSEFQ